jgi:hypothetical protein
MTYCNTDCKSNEAKIQSWKGVVFINLDCPFTSSGYRQR